MLKPVCIFHVKILKHESLLMQSVILFNIHFVCDELLSYFFFYWTGINMPITCFPFHKSIMDFPKFIDEVSIFCSLKWCFWRTVAEKKQFLWCIDQHLIVIFVEIYKPNFFCFKQFLHFPTCIMRSSYEVCLHFLIYCLFDKHG